MKAVKMTAWNVSLLFSWVVSEKLCGSESCCHVRVNRWVKEHVRYFGLKIGVTHKCWIILTSKSMSIDEKSLPKSTWKWKFLNRWKLVLTLSGINGFSIELFLVNWALAISEWVSVCFRWWRVLHDDTKQIGFYLLSEHEMYNSKGIHNLEVSVGERTALYR